MASIILASHSAARNALLKNAGVSFVKKAADIDERAVEAPLKDAGFSVGDIASVLAEAKATEVSRQYPDDLVIGADQMMSYQDGNEQVQMTKAPSLDEARRHLLALQGKMHILHAALCCVKNGEVVFRYSDEAHMTMRSLSPAQIGRYVSMAGENILGSVGCYHLEGLGIQLFEKIEGDYFTILGLPLLPLLDFLRKEDELSL